MQRYGRLKMAHFMSIVCFAIMVGCLVSIYGQSRTMRAELKRTEQELAANPARAKITKLQNEIAQLQDKLKTSSGRNASLTRQLADQDKVIAAQREELKAMAEQLRVHGVGK